MPKPWSTINVRIPPIQVKRFKDLETAFAYLPRSTLIRLIFGMVLDMPLDQQKRLITTKLSTGNVPTHVPSTSTPPKPISLPTPNKNSSLLQPVQTLNPKNTFDHDHITLNRNLRGLKIRGRKPKPKPKPKPKSQKH